MALAIIPSETSKFHILYVSGFATFPLSWWLEDLHFIFVDTAPTFNSSAVESKDFDPTGWELALVTTPSTNISSATERQLVGPCFARFLFYFFIICFLKLSLDSCTENVFGVFCAGLSYWLVHCLKQAYLRYFLYIIV